MYHCFVYVLRCSDATLYTGWTNDLIRRLEKHRSGQASKYTRVRLPVDLVYFEEFEDKSSAMKRECAIKKLSKAQKERMIADAKSHCPDFAIQNVSKTAAVKKA